MITTMLARAMGKWSYVFLALLAVIAVLVPVMHLAVPEPVIRCICRDLCGRADGQVPVLCAAGTFG
jgi:hypothetical protein